MRYSLLVLIALAGLTAAEQARSEQPTTFKELWNFFHERCGLALSDPDQYLATLKIPGPDGGGVAVSAPDNRIVQVLTGRGGMQEYYLVAVAADKRLHHCEVVGYGSAGMNSSEYFDSEFKSILAANPQINVSGGFMPHDLYFGDEQSMEEVTSIDDAFIYVLSQAHKNPDVLVELSFAEGEIQIVGHLTETTVR